MGEWLGWALLAGLALVVICVFALSSQLHRNLQFILQILDSNQRILLSRIDRLGDTQRAAAQPERVERRIAQRRSPASQMQRYGHNGDRRKSPGRRNEDLQVARAAGFFPAN